MNTPKTLDAAKSIIAELSAQVVEIESLREKASKVNLLEEELGSAKNLIESMRISQEERQASFKNAEIELGQKLDLANNRILELEMKEKSAGLKALEILGRSGGPQLSVSNDSQEELTLSELAKAVQAEQDPVKKFALYKQYKKKQSSK